jgi:triosephosphate isomerase
MAQKKTLIVGNWKMHLNTMQASILVHRLQERIRIYRDVEVVLAPNIMVLQPLSLQIDRRKFRLSAQNAYHKDTGAFTGEVSMSMLRDLAHYCIVGHSERRIYFGETDKDISEKVSAALRNGIMPIVCVGETKTERLSKHSKRVVHHQVVAALKNVTAEEIDQICIAYEPVWAISTFGGELATPGQAKEMMDYIRMQVRELFGERAVKKVRILYGGSVDDQTARGYLELEGCDGALVGGASISYHKFSRIVDTAYQLRQEAGEE